MIGGLNGKNKTLSVILTFTNTMPKKFEDMAKRIMKQYEKKGYTHKEAERIGYGTANKIFRKK